VILSIAALVLAVVQPAQPDIHDLMPAFWQAYDAPSRDGRVEEIKERIVLPVLQFYADGEFFDNLSDEGIGAYLDGLKTRASLMRELSERIPAELPAEIANVQAALPDLSLARIHFYVLPSFDHFSGQTHDYRDGVGVFFGVDDIIEHGQENFNVVVAHELFHIYQFETHPGYDTDALPLWGLVWAEGSAAYASQHLVRGATMNDALGPDLAGATPATIKALACNIQSNWGSHSERATRDLLDTSAHPPRLPPLGGYLIGYLAARDFAATHTLAQLGSAKTGEAEAALKTTIDHLCSGSTTTAASSE